MYEFTKFKNLWSLETILGILKFFIKMHRIFMKYSNFVAHAEGAATAAQKLLLCLGSISINI